MARIIHLVFIFLISPQVNAQEDGYILAAGIDTLWGELDLAKGIKRQSEVGFRENSSERFTTYSPSVITGYGSERSGHYIATNSDRALEQIFLDNLSFVRRITSGDISVFRYDEKVRIFVGSAAGFETTIRYVAGDNKGYKLLSPETFAEEVAKDKAANGSLKFGFFDFDVADFYARRASRAGGKVEIVITNKRKDKTLHPYLEGGVFRNNWETDQDIFRDPEFNAGTRLQISGGLSTSLGSRFWLKAGLNYTTYENSAIIKSIAGNSFENSGEEVVVTHKVSASYLGVDFIGGYDVLDFKRGAFYANFRMGVGSILSNEVKVQDFLQREGDNSRRVLFSGPFNYDEPEERDPRAYLPGTMIGIGAGVGFSLRVADRLAPFIEIRGQSNTTTGRKYTYAEVGVFAGVVF